MSEVKETVSADTLKPNPNGSAKAKMMADALLRMQGMSVEDLSHFLNDSLAQIGKEAKHIPDGAADRNKATVAMKEDIESMFGDTLSEEFKDQALTLFEAHVAQRVAIEMANLSEQFQENLTEAVDAKLEELTDQLDKYISYAADEYMSQNELAIENGIKSEIAEQFMGKLKDLFTEAWIEIPEDRVNVVDELTARCADLEDKLNQLVNVNIKLNDTLNELERNSVIESFKDGLTEMQADKFESLAEGLNYDSVEELEEKLLILKNSMLNNKHVSTGIMKEESDPEDLTTTLLKEENNNVQPLSPTQSFMRAMQKTSAVRV